MPHRKNTAGMSPVKMTIPKTVTIPMSMHIGKPAVPTVKAGDKVCVGTIIGQADGFVSAPVHSSVSGTVKKIEDILTKLVDSKFVDLFSDDWDKIAKLIFDLLG